MLNPSFHRGSGLSITTAARKKSSPGGRGGSAAVKNVVAAFGFDLLIKVHVEIFDGSNSFDEESHPLCCHPSFLAKM